MKNFIVVVVLLFTMNSYADTYDKWKISAGGMFVTDFGTTMQLAPKNYPIAAKIDTRDQLNMTYDTGVLRVGGYYRFTPKHRVEFDYYKVKSDGVVNSYQDIEYDNHTIKAGANITSYFDMTVYKLNYGYSFYHNEDIELLLTAGLHITRLDLGLSASGTIIADDTNTTGSAYASSAGVTVPLPVFGFKGEYAIIQKKFYATLATEYFALKIDDYKGSFINTQLLFEYRFVEHYGLGVGFNSTIIKVETDDGVKKLDVENRLAGVIVNLSYTY